MLWKSRADKAKDAWIGSLEAHLESLRAENIYLRTQISDLLSQLATLSQKSELKEKELLERLLDTVTPYYGKARVSRPPLTQEEIIPIFPGYRPDLRPPDPISEQS